MILQTETLVLTPFRPASHLEAINQAYQVLLMDPLPVSNEDQDLQQTTVLQIPQLKNQQTQVALTPYRKRQLLMAHGFNPFHQTIDDGHSGLNKEKRRNNNIQLLNSFNELITQLIQLSAKLHPQRFDHRFFHNDETVQIEESLDQPGSFSITLLSLRRYEPTRTLRLTQASPGQIPTVALMEKASQAHPPLDTNSSGIHDDIYLHFQEVIEVALAKLSPEKRAEQQALAFRQLINALFGNSVQNRFIQNECLQLPATASGLAQSMEFAMEKTVENKKAILIYRSQPTAMTTTNKDQKSEVRISCERKSHQTTIEMMEDSNWGNMRKKKHHLFSVENTDFDSGNFNLTDTELVTACTRLLKLRQQAAVTTPLPNAS